MPNENRSVRASSCLRNGDGQATLHRRYRRGDYGFGAARNSGATRTIKSPGAGRTRSGDPEGTREGPRGALPARVRSKSRPGASAQGLGLSLVDDEPNCGNGANAAESLDLGFECCGALDPDWINAVALA